MPKKHCINASSFFCLVPMPPTTTITHQLPVALEQFNQGIQSVDDYQRYLSLLKHADDFNPNVFDPLYKTVDGVVLKRFAILYSYLQHCTQPLSCSIGESQEFGKVMKQILDTACNSWNEDMIKTLLKVCLDNHAVFVYSNNA